MSLDSANNNHYFNQLKDKGFVTISSNSDRISNSFKEWLEYIEYPFSLIETEQTDSGIMISTFVRRK